MNKRRKVDRNIAFYHVIGRLFNRWLTRNRHWSTDRTDNPFFCIVGHNKDRLVDQLSTINEQQEAFDSMLDQETIREYWYSHRPGKTEEFCDILMNKTTSILISDFDELKKLDRDTDACEIMGKLLVEKLNMDSASEDLYTDFGQGTKIRLYKVLKSYFEKNPDQHILLIVDVGNVFDCDLNSLMVCTLANDMDNFKNLHVVFNNVPQKYIQQKGMPTTRRDIVVLKT